MAVDQITLADARRIALAAQGFGEPRPARVDIRHLRAMVQRIGVLQLDSVNVVCRSHYLPLFSRLGPYPRASLDRMVWGRNSTRDLFEYFRGHRAAVLPVSAHRFLRWRMRAAAEDEWAGRPGDETQVPSAVAEGMQRLSRERPSLITDVLHLVRDQGPSTAAEVRDPESGRRPTEEGGRMWNWRDTKIAVEALFAAGRLAITDRRNFERVYDVTERVIPAAVLEDEEPAVEEAQREMVRVAARASGIATVRELCAPGRSYVALPAGVGKFRVDELVDAGELIPVRVQDLAGRYFRWHETSTPRPIAGQALLSPFDSLIWTRERTERFFGFRYRTSIYLPEAQRIDGYYVMPFLAGESVVARVDLRAESKNASLHVPVVNAEPDADRAEVSDRLAVELTAMAEWLGLGSVTVGDRGNLAQRLRASLRA